MKRQTKKEKQEILEKKLRELHGYILDLAIESIHGKTDLSIRDLIDQIERSLSMAIFMTSTSEGEESCLVEKKKLIDQAILSTTDGYVCTYDKLMLGDVPKVNFLDT
jgi:hypothetical protein